MKVRLKHFVCLQRYRLALFQFHEGPIKTQGELVYVQLLMSFNSMKVRLKQNTA